MWRQLIFKDSRFLQLFVFNIISFHILANMNCCDRFNAEQQYQSHFYKAGTGLLCAEREDVEKVREKRAAKMNLRSAVTAAVDECIKENVPADFFREHRKEIVDIGIYEFDEDVYERVIREGREEEGMAKGRAEAILDLLEDLGKIPEELRQKIMEQRDLDVLKKRHKLSARAKSIEEFTKGIYPENMTD